MFCKNCGNQMNDDALFCNNCGTPVGEINATTATTINNDFEDNEIKLIVNPTFVLGYQIILALGKVIVAVLMVWYFIFDILTHDDDIILFLLVTGVVATIWQIIKLFFIKKQYAKTNYNFYRTKVEYADGFLDKAQKEVKYKFVREVTMTQNILERMFGIGRILLYTNASSVGSGIGIHCVKNVNENLKAIKALIDEADVNDD